MKEIGYGADYQYSHSYEASFSKQEYLPDEIAGMKFYEPGNNAREKEMKDHLKRLWGDKYNY
jgi:putative ATPase